MHTRNELFGGYFFFTLLYLTAQMTFVTARRNELNQETYEPDVSWAVYSKKLQWNSTQELYNGFIKECQKAAGEGSRSSCDESERTRLWMNKDQPSSMRNYTRLGFEKIKAPPHMFSLIKKFWDENREKNETEWHSINTYHNMWGSPPTIVNIQTPKSGGNAQLSNDVWEAARHTLEEWTGMHLSPCSIWGIRIYHNNSILTPHVDRNPLVTSAIINVDQDVDEPWPLEVWGHDGMPYNITMDPGDMILYESHSVIHGRPFPMRGRHFANIFVHFEPLGAFRRESKDPTDNEDYSQEMIYHEDALESRKHNLPPYIIPGSTWAKEWKKQNSDGWQLLKNNMGLGVEENNVGAVDNLFIQNPQSVHKVDGNGWNALHLTSRAGHVNMAKYLSEKGVNLDTKTNAGETALYLAKHYHGENSDIFKFLKGIGAQIK